MKTTYMPKASQLSECVDETGVVNLGQLHTLCIDLLFEIENHRQGSGNRTRATLHRLASVMESFLVRHQFAEHVARRWFFSQPHAEFCLQLFADEADGATDHAAIGKRQIEYAAILERRAERIAHESSL